MGFRRLTSRACLATDAGLYILRIRQSETGLERHAWLSTQLCKRVAKTTASAEHRSQIRMPARYGERRKKRRGDARPLG